MIDYLKDYMLSIKKLIYLIYLVTSWTYLSMGYLCGNYMIKKIYGKPHHMLSKFLKNKILNNPKCQNNVLKRLYKSGNLTVSSGYFLPFLSDTTVSQLTLPSETPSNFLAIFIFPTTSRWGSSKASYATYIIFFKQIICFEEL